MQRSLNATLEIQGLETSKKIKTIGQDNQSLNYLQYPPH